MATQQGPGGPALPTNISVDIPLRLSEIAAQWKQVAGLVKDAERFDDRVIFPAINQLRYAGGDLVDAWALFASDAATSEVNERIVQLIFDAETHVKIARHDLTDSVITHIYFFCKELIESFGKSEVTKQMAEFGELWDKLDETNKKISRARKQPEQRDEIYASIENDDLMEFIVSNYALLAAEKALIVQRIEYKKIIDAQLRLGKRSFWMGIGLTLISVVFALISDWQRFAENISAMSETIGNAVDGFLSAFKQR